MKNKKPGPNPPGTPKVPLTPFITTDPAAAYQRFLPVVEALSAGSVKICNVDFDIARHNVGRGMDSLEPHLAEVHRKLPEISIPEIQEVRSVALALGFAAGRVFTRESDGAIAERLAQMRPLREMTLSQIEIFAGLGLVPRERATSIRAGNGPLDSAHDAVAIAAVFQEYAEVIAHKHPFTAAQLAELSEHGQWLIPQLKPTGAAEGPQERDPAAVVRDRFWTLLNTRYDLAREAGVVIFGLKSIDDRMPPLGSRIVQPAALKPAATPALPPLQIMPPAATLKPTLPIG